MTDADLIGYALDLLDPDERAAVEARLEANPAAAAELDRVRAALLPLEADREDDRPPPALATRTVARLASYLVADAPVPDAPRPPTSRPRSYPSADPPEPRYVGGRFRVDLVVAAGIGLVAVGLLLSFVNRARYASEVAACQNNLRVLHRGLAGYADTHAGRFPQVGTDPYPTAGTFVKALADAGQYPPGFYPTCPAAPRPVPGAATEPPASPVAYAYPLGHRTPEGIILGLWRSTDPADENDLLPAAADYPVSAAAPGGGPASPHRWGHNVLYVGGNVRFATVSTVGVDGDDIYRNRLGQVAAGVTRVDAVLGRAGDRP